MSFGINIKSIDLNKVTKSEYANKKDNNGTYHINFYYKYDFNLTSELKLLTNTVSIKKIYTNFNYIRITVNSPELKSIYDKINNMFNLNNLNNNLNNNKKTDIVYSSSESESESESNCEVNIYFKNNISELKLHPTKKSGLEEYTLTKNENSNKIHAYYPYVNKYDIEGDFILKLYVFKTLNNVHYMKFIILSGNLKHPMSFVKKDNTIKNVYDTSKINIDI